METNYSTLNSGKAFIYGDSAMKSEGTENPPLSATCLYPTNPLLITFRRD